MKLSKTTLDIFKNFAAINSNLKLSKGNKISTVSAAKDIFAEVETVESFPKEVGIYNLNEFLGVISLFKDPEFDFSDKEVTIKEGRNKIRYVFSDVSLLTVPSKEVKMPSVDIEFDLAADSIVRILKSASALSAMDLAIIGDGEKVSIKVMDAKNPTSNDFEFDLETETDKTFKVYMKIEKLKILPGDYTISISSKKIANFKNKNIGLQYFIAVEAPSTFS